MIHRFVLKTPDRRYLMSATGEAIDLATLLPVEMVNTGEHVPMSGEIRFEATSHTSPDLPWFELALYVDDTQLTPEQLALVRRAVEEPTDGE